MKLTESQLYNVIKESVMMTLNEFGNTPEVRGKMARAARRGIDRGDDSVYNNAVSSLIKRNSSKEELSKFQDDVESDDFNEQPVNAVAENQIRLSEKQLYRVLKESVNRVLSELKWQTISGAANKAWEYSQ